MKNFLLKRIIIIKVIVILIFLVVSGCNEIELKSKRLASPINIDGNLKEWDELAFVAFEDSSIMLAASNDNKFYYLGGEILDRRIGRMFALGGITLIINPGGDKEKNIEMSFTYPGTKHIDYRKGGFFEALNDDQKLKVLKNLEPLNNSVSVIDTSELKSLVFAGTGDTNFQGEILISDNKLFFEIKIPFQIDNYFKSHNSLNEKSLFYLTPGSDFKSSQMLMGMPFQGRDVNRSERKESFSNKPEGFERGNPTDFQYWFSIKANGYE